MNADQLLQGPHKNRPVGRHDIVVDITGPRPLPGDLHQQRAAQRHPPAAGHFRPGLRADPARAAQLRADSPARVRRIGRRQGLT